jgi:hypothetical protein
MEAEAQTCLAGIDQCMAMRRHGNKLGAMCAAASCEGDAR